VAVAAEEEAAVAGAVVAEAAVAVAGEVREKEVER